MQNEALAPAKGKDACKSRCLALATRWPGRPSTPPPAGRIGPSLWQAVALAEIARGSNRRYDASVVAAWIELFEVRGFTLPALDQGQDDSFRRTCRHIARQPPRRMLKPRHGLQREGSSLPDEPSLPARMRCFLFGAVCGMINSTSIRRGSADAEGEGTRMTARILIVDDVPANARPLEDRLAAEYYQTATAHDGFEALELARSWQPDLILLDIFMPGMDGYACCRKLKEDPNTRHIPVVMVTDPGEPADRVRGLEAGADDFLTKPVEDATLVARIQSLVRLKRLLDEWRARGDTARTLGLVADSEVEPPVAGARALVIDDWELGAQNVQDALARVGVLAGRARNEPEALALCGGIGFDLIVLSLGMGEQDPLKLVSSLRAADVTHDIPLLLLAEPGQRERVIRGFELGANDWLVLPLDDTELQARARNQIRRKFYQDRLRAEVGTAMEPALIDPLTGLYNQRYLMRHLTGLLAVPHLQNLALLMIDVDHFKRVNDEFGHAAGDDALREIAAGLRTGTRASDSVARYGGEEFVVVMPATTCADAMAAAERLRCDVEALRFEPLPGQRCRVTVSIGVACARSPHPTSEALLRASDQALYDAKRAGRNRVSLAETG